MALNIFSVRGDIECYGLWYAIWRHGWRNGWTIFVAWRMAVRDARSRAFGARL
jgi:hypothetical protein